MPVRVVDWSWELRLTASIVVFLIVGGGACLLFAGKLWARVGWVALALASPQLIAQAIWSDPAYPHLGYLVSVTVTVIGSVGALLTLAIVKPHR